MKGKITLLIFIAALAANATTKAGPLEMGPGNKALLAKAYSDYERSDRSERRHMNIIRGVYAIEKAVQICTNWKVYPQENHDACVAGLSRYLLR